MDEDLTETMPDSHLAFQPAKHVGTSKSTRLGSHLQLQAKARRAPLGYGR
jgi:hypothetical protein